MKTDPNYYKDNKPELTELIRSWKLDWCEGNAIKYIRRHKYKNKEQDILKAIWYLTNILENDYGNKSARSIKKSITETEHSITLKTLRPYRT